MSLRHYISIARPDHWVKQVFVLPGIVLALAFSQQTYTELALSIVIGMISVCAIASANYTINEWLDAASDAQHPTKKLRASVRGFITARYVYLQYAVLGVIGLGLAWYISQAFFLVSLFFICMGVLYNVEPFRLKDVAYLDVISESVNNPIRFLLGWFMVSTAVLPPSTIILSVFFAGAFLMATKRYAEYVYIENKETLVLYRKSFANYTAESLLVSAFFYALCSVFFLGIFMIKYRVELVLSFPFLAGVFAWYLAIAFKRDSRAKSPEGLYYERNFIVYIVCVIALIGILLVTPLPALDALQHNIFVQ